MVGGLRWHTDAGEAKAESMRLRRPIYLDVFKEH